MLCKLFCYKVFVHWKFKLLNFLMDLVLMYFTVFFPGTISIGNMKKGIKFRDSSVLNFILFFKKSELFKISIITGQEQVNRIF